MGKGGQRAVTHGRAERGPGSAAMAVLLAGLVLAACQPTVRVEAPKEPITINLNIKLDADVRLRIERQAEEDIQGNPDIF